MKASRWIVLFATLSSCDSSGSGIGSNVEKCNGTSECAAGFVCTAGTCSPLDASVGSGGGGGSSPRVGSGGAGRSGAVGAGGNGVAGASVGGNPGAGGSVAGGGTAGNAGASSHPDAGTDSSVATDGASGDASASAACFDSLPGVCGAIAPWTPAPSANGWTVYRATPLEGADGFAALLVHGTFGSADSYAFATLDAAGGCATLVAAPWTNVVRFAGVHRAVSRGGTLALVGDCVQRFGCGATLFLNGKEWNDPLGPASFIDVDVANDGRVFVVTTGNLGVDAAAGQLVERWLSPSGEVLAERRSPEVTVNDVAVLEDGTVALAVSYESASAVWFQSAALDDVASWDLGATRIVHALGARGPLLAVAGAATNNNPWTGVLDVRTHAEVWTRTRTDLTGIAFAVEIDPSGALDAAVWQGPFGFTSYLLLDETKAAPGIATKSYDPMYPTGPARMNPFSGIRTQANGQILFSTDFAGTYCDGD